MKTRLQDDLKVAMKAQDRLALETIRAIMSAFQYEEMQRGVEVLPENVTIELLQREVKKRKEEIEFAEKAGRGEAKEKALKEISIIERYLPQQLDATALEKIVTDLKVADSALNMGGAMKALKDAYGGQYDSKVASEIAKRVCG